MIQQTTNVHCPFCLKDQGYVRAVRVQCNHRTLTYTCQNCKQSWDGVPEATPILPEWASEPQPSGR